jgi:hypothetical protein
MKFEILKKDVVVNSTSFEPEIELTMKLNLALGVPEPHPAESNIIEVLGQFLYDAIEKYAAENPILHD